MAAPWGERELPVEQEGSNVLMQSAKTGVWQYLRNWWVMWSLQAGDRSRGEIPIGMRTLAR